MITDEILGDMFKSDCQTYACPINKVGTMGNGLALYFSKRYPNVLPIYKRHCSIGTFNTELVTVPVFANKRVLLIPTKNHWKEDSNAWLVEHSLKILACDYEKLGIESLAMPKIACGKGNMDFDEIRELIYKYLDPIDLSVKIYI